MNLKLCLLRIILLETLCFHLLPFTAQADMPLGANKSQPGLTSFDRLTGMVVDHNGRGIGGVGVRFLLRPGTPDDDEGVADTKTNESGKFELRVKPKLRDLTALIAATEDGTQMAIQQFPWLDEDRQPVTDVRLELNDSVRLDVVVADANGEPARATRVCAYTQDSGFPFLATTNDEGRASLRLPADIHVETVFAFAAGQGLDYQRFRRTMAGGMPVGQNRGFLATDVPQPVKLAFQGTRPFKVRVVEAPGNLPIVGVRVCPYDLGKPDRTTISLVKLVDEFAVTTNEDGLAAFDWFPQWSTNRSLRVWSAPETWEKWSFSEEKPIRDDTLELVCMKRVPLTGRVMQADGKPVAGIRIRANGQGSIRLFRGDATTGADGQYQILAAPDQAYLLTVVDQKWAAAPHQGFTVLPNTPVSNLDFTLLPATRVFGRVTGGEEMTPIPNLSFAFVQWSQDNQAINPALARSKALIPRTPRFTKTDQAGRYELFLGPGQFNSLGPTQRKEVKFEITDQKSLEFNFDVPQPKFVKLEGLVVTGEPPEPVANARIHGEYWSSGTTGNFTVKTNAEGRFQTMRKNVNTDIFVTDEMQTLAGLARIRADNGNVTIELSPMAGATGRLVNTNTGLPLSNHEITCDIFTPINEETLVPVRTAFGGTIRTDQEGRFTVKYPPVNRSFDIAVTAEDGQYSRCIGKILAPSNKPTDLGDLELKPVYSFPFADQ